MIRRAGTRRGFEAFARAHGDGLLRLAYALCGDRGRAEDAVQEALARVYPRFSRLEDPLGYARRIAVNATRDDWRRHTRQERLRQEIARLPAAEPTDPMARFIERDALLGALDVLPHRQRAVIVLRYLSQLSEAETAAVLGVSIGTVKSQHARALPRLRAALDAGPATHPLEPA